MGSFRGKRLLIQLAGINLLHARKQVDRHCFEPRYKEMIEFLVSSDSWEPGKMDPAFKITLGRPGLCCKLSVLDQVDRSPAGRIDKNWRSSFR